MPGKVTLRAFRARQEHFVIPPIKAMLVSAAISSELDAAQNGSILVSPSTWGRAVAGQAAGAQKPGRN